MYTLISAAAMLARPLPVAGGVELHDEEVLPAVVGLTIDGPVCVAGDENLPAVVIHRHGRAVVCC